MSAKIRKGNVTIARARASLAPRRDAISRPYISPVHTPSAILYCSFQGAYRDAPRCCTGRLALIRPPAARANRGQIGRGAPFDLLRFLIEPPCLCKQDSLSLSLRRPPYNKLVLASYHLIAPYLYDGDRSLARAGPRSREVSSRPGKSADAVFGAHAMEGASLSADTLPFFVCSRCHGALLSTVWHDLCLRHCALVSTRISRRRRRVAFLLRGAAVKSSVEVIDC